MSTSNSADNSADQDTEKNPETAITYKDAGVDIDAGNALVDRIKSVSQKTRRPEVMGSLGGFGALCELPKNYREPILVSGTDGVGTKLRLALDLNQHDTVGIDLVAMCVNDLIVIGAEPLFFLDYYATGKLKVELASDVIKGIGKGCELSGCSLIGGETAEMPGMYHGEDYDLAGFCVGVVEKSEIIDGSQVKAGDKLIGLASSGPHSNGFSLIRKLIEKDPDSLHKTLADTNKTLANTLMEPTRIYVKNVLNVLKQHQLKAISHITGGGFTENIPRVLPDSCVAHINTNAWEMSECFQWIQKTANISDAEMYKTFNCGVGLVIAVDAEDCTAIQKAFNDLGETCFELGSIELSSSTDEEQVIYR